MAASRRPLGRVALVVVSVLAGALVLGALYLRSSAGQRALTERLRQAAAGAGVEARFTGVSLDLLARELGAEELALAVPGKRPFLVARGARVRVALAALLGRAAVDRLAIDSLSLDVERGADGAFNLPAAANRDGPSPRGPERLPVNTLRIRDAALCFADAASGSLLDAPGLSLDLAGRDGAQRGSLRAARPLRVRLGSKDTEVQASELAFVFDRGDLSFGPWTLQAREGRLDVQGALRDALGAGLLDVALEARADLRQAAPQSARLAGAVELKARLRGTLADPRGEFDLRARELAASGLRATGVELSGTFDAGAMTLASLNAAVAGGRVAASARLPWSDGEAEASSDWSGLDLAMLLDGAGVPPAAAPRPGARLRGALQAAWPAGRWREARASALLVAAGEAGTGGRATPLTGEARLLLRDAAWTLRIERARMAGIDLRGEAGGSLADSIGSSGIAGQVTLHVDDLAGTWPLLRGGVALPRAASSAVPSSGAAPSGSLAASIDISGRLGAPTARFRVEGHELAAPALPSVAAGLRANGTLARVAGVGAEIATTARPGADRSDAPGAQVEAADLRQQASRWRLDVEGLTLESAAGRAEAKGSLDLPTGRLRASATASLLDLAALRPLLPDGLDPFGPLAARASAEGTWPDVVARAEVSGGPLRLARQTFARLQAELRADSRSLTLDTASLAPEDGGQVTLAGTLSLRGRRPFELTLGLDDADMSQAARAQAAAVGRAVASLQAKAKGSLEGAPTAEHLEPKPFEVEAAEIRWTRLDVESGKGRLTLGGPAQLAFGPKHVAVEGLALLAGSTRLAVDGRLDGAAGSRLQARLTGRVLDLARLLERPAAADDATAGQGPAEAAPSAQDAADAPAAPRGALEGSIVWTGDPQRPDAAARLVVEGGAAAGLTDLSLLATYLDGVLDLERLSARAPGVVLAGTGRASAALVAEKLPEAIRSRLTPRAPSGSLHFELRPSEAGTDAPLGFLAGGSLTGDLETDVASLAGLRGELAVSGVVLRTQGATLAQEGSGRIEVADGAARLSGLEWRGEESSLRLGGEVRLAGGTAPLRDARMGLHADGRLDLRMLGAAARGVEGGGTARVNLELRGTPAVPELVGEVRLRETLVRYLPRRLSLDGLSGRFVLADGSLRLEDVTGSVNGGRFEARGALQLRGLRPTSGRVELEGHGATVDWPRGFLGELDAKLAVEARDGRTTLSGEVGLASGSYTGNPRVLFTELEEWRALPSEPSALDPLRFDLRVRTLQDLQADTIYGRLGLSADVALTGTFAQPQLEGRIQAAPGAEFYLGGRKYAVDSLTVDYTKAAGLVPFVRSGANTRVSGYDITAHFTGPLEDLSVQLSSDPPLADQQIASLLTTGSTKVGKAADAGAVSLAAGDLLGGVGRGVGLDTVRLESGESDEFLSADPTAVAGQEDPDSRLTLTKRLTPQIEVTLSQALARGGKRTTFVDYRPRRGIELRASERDDQTHAVELRHDLSFGAEPGGQASRRTTRERRQGRVGSARAEVVPGRHAAGVPAAAELTRLLELCAGDAFDYRRWLADRDRLQQALARAGFFEARIFATREPRFEADAATDQPIALLYRVRPGARTTLRFTGFAPPDALRRSIEQAWWQADYVGAIEDEAAAATRASLVDRGHVLAAVQAESRSPAEGVKELVVSVEPGPRASRRAVVFVGAQRTELARLQEMVRSKAQLRAAFREPAALRAALLELLEGDGLLAAKVETRTLLRGETAVLEVVLDEGPLFSLGAVSVSGTSGLSEQAVREAAGLASAEPYRRQSIDSARDRVRKLYRSQGFTDASVKLDGTISAAKASVDVALRVSEGPRKVVRSVRVDGDSGLFSERLVRFEGLKEGDPVVPEGWSKIRRELYETGLLRSVELQAEPGGAQAASGEPEPTDLRLTLLGWPKLRLRYGLQLAGTRDPLIEEGNQQFRLGGIAEVTRRSLFGRALTAGLSGQGREGFLEGRGYLSLPRTLGTPLRSSLFYRRTHADLPIAVLGNRSEITDDSTELTFEERLRAGGKLEVAGAYSMQWTRLHGEVFFFGPLDERLRLARLTAAAVLDGRDNLVDPQRGYFHSTSFEYGSPRLGSDFTFTRLLLQQFVYVPVRFRSVLALAARFERSSGADQALLTSGSLAAGGANSVRGYPEDYGQTGLGGTDSATSKLLVLNQELRFPILGSLFGGAFFDHASRWEADQGRVLERSSLGFGLRYRTPVGVLRLDFGYPLDGLDRKLRVYFALGQAF